MSDRNLEIEADVPSERLLGLTSGTEIAVLLDDGSRHKARVKAVIPDENTAARTRPVRFIPVFGAMQTSLANNQPVTLLVPTGAPAEVISVNKRRSITARRAGAGLCGRERCGAAASSTTR